MNCKLFFYTICVITEAVFIIPVKFPSLHLTTFKFNRKEIVQAIDVRLLRDYHNQDKYERPLNNFKFTNISNASNICGQKKDNSVVPCYKQKFYVNFNEINISGKKESFFKTDDNLCLTIGEKDSKTYGYNLKLKKCTFDCSQKFTILSSDDYESLSNQDKKITLNLKFKKQLENNLKVKENIKIAESSPKNVENNKKCSVMKYTFPTHDTCGQKISYNVRIPPTSIIDNKNNMLTNTV